MTEDRLADESPAERGGPRPLTILLSLALHVLGFGIAFGLPRIMPRPAVGPPVYVVDLVSFPSRSTRKAVPRARPAASKKTTPRKPPPKKDPIKIPDRGAERKVTQKKPPQAPKPKPPEPKPPEPATGEPEGIEPAAPTEGETAAAPQTAPDISGVPATGTGTGGVGVSLGAVGEGGTRQSDEYTFYLSLLDRNIRRVWEKPLYTGRHTLTSTVTLELTRSGRVASTQLIRSSGYDALDRSVLRAVQDAQPFPPFPHFLGLDALTVQIVFELSSGEGEGPAISGE